MPGDPAIQHEGRRLEVEVLELKGAPGAWTVEAIDVEGDGEIYQAIFMGRDAEARASEYARWKY